MTKGDFKKKTKVVREETSEETAPVKSQQTAKKVAKGPFQVLGLSEAVCKAIAKLGFKLPTPIQRKAVPAILRGCDCVAMARTGSGKTGAFVAPLISRLDAHSEVVGVRAVILSPTRELAMQTAKVCRSLMKFTDLRCTLLVGGQSMEAQFDKLTNNPDILIATPGRLLHHMKEAGLSLERAELLVFDEADRLFEMGMSDQLYEILQGCPTERQALLFSATLPTKLVEFARVGLKNCEYIKLDSEHTLSDTLKLNNLYIRSDAKIASLLRTLIHLDASAKGKKSIVFVATRHHVDFFEQLLKKHNISAAGIYGSMDQICRTNAIQNFRQGKVSVLVVTDVAARGIDIPLLDFVVNYDFPPSPKLFVHRAGRTARNGKDGMCVNLITADDLPYALELMLFLGKKLEIGGIADTADCEESVKKVISDDVALDSAKQSMTLAYGPYFKTRPAASKESMRRAKQFVTEHGGNLNILGRVHAMFKSEAEMAAPNYQQQEAGYADILAQLRAFRPNAESALSFDTLDKFNKAVVAPRQLRTEIKVAFRKPVIVDDVDYDAVDAPTEAGIEHSEDEACDNSEDGSVVEEEDGDDDMVLDDDDDEVLPSKPLEDEFDVEITSNNPSSKRRRVELAPGLSVFDQTSCRAKDFFLGITKSQDEKADTIFDLQGLDIVPDDSNDMRKNMTVKKWDNKRKRYVLMQLGPDGRPLKQNRTVNESGKRLKSKDMADGEMYAKWSKHAQKRLQRPGEQEQAFAAKQSKTVDFDEQPGSDDDEDDNSGAVNSTKYHGKVPQQFLTNKQKRKEKQSAKRAVGTVTSRGDERGASKMKGIEQMAKDRMTMKTKKIMQNPKARKDFSKKSKDQYMARQQAAINRPHKNSRSRVVGGGATSGPQRGGRGGRGGRR